MSIGVIVGSAPLGGEASELYELLQNNAISVAADGGIRFFLERGIEPTKWIGDMDSCDCYDDVIKAFPHIDMSSCSPIKDVTDTEIAINELINMKVDNIIIFGGVGGRRVSHTLANIQLISGYKKKGVSIKLVGDGVKLFVIADGESVEYSETSTGFVSVLALSDIAENVKIEGLFYGFEGDLTNTNALGVSNEFKGDSASISVGRGKVLIIEEVK